MCIKNGSRVTQNKGDAMVYNIQENVQENVQVTGDLRKKMDSLLAVVNNTVASPKDRLSALNKLVLLEERYVPEENKRFVKKGQNFTYVPENCTSLNAVLEEIVGSIKDIDQQGVAPIVIEDCMESFCTAVASFGLVPDAMFLPQLDELASIPTYPNRINKLRTSYTGSQDGGEGYVSEKRRAVATFREHLGSDVEQGKVEAMFNRLDLEAQYPLAYLDISEQEYVLLKDAFESSNDENVNKILCQVQNRNLLRFAAVIDLGVMEKFPTGNNAATDKPIEGENLSRLANDIRLVVSGNEANNVFSEFEKVFERRKTMALKIVTKKAGRRGGQFDEIAYLDKKDKQWSSSAAAASLSSGSSSSSSESIPDLVLDDIPIAQAKQAYTLLQENNTLNRIISILNGQVDAVVVNKKSYMLGEYDLVEHYPFAFASLPDQELQEIARNIESIKDLGEETDAHKTIVNSIKTRLQNVHQQCVERLELAVNGNFISDLGGVSGQALSGTLIPMLKEKNLGVLIKSFEGLKKMSMVSPPSSPQTASLTGHAHVHLLESSPKGSSLKIDEGEAKRRRSTSAIRGKAAKHTTLENIQIPASMDVEDAMEVFATLYLSTNNSPTVQDLKEPKLKAFIEAVNKGDLTVTFIKDRRVIVVANPKGIDVSSKIPRDIVGYLTNFRDKQAERVEAEPPSLTSPPRPRARTTSPHMLQRATAALRRKSTQPVQAKIDVSDFDLSLLVKEVDGSEELTEQVQQQLSDLLQKNGVAIDYLHATFGVASYQQDGGKSYLVFNLNSEKIPHTKQINPTLIKKQIEGLGAQIKRALTPNSKILGTSASGSTHELVLANQGVDLNAMRTAFDKAGLFGLQVGTNDKDQTVISGVGDAIRERVQTIVDNLIQETRNTGAEYATVPGAAAGVGSKEKLAGEKPLAHLPVAEVKDVNSTLEYDTLPSSSNGEPENAVPVYAEVKNKGAERGGGSSSGQKFEPVYQEFSREPVIIGTLCFPSGCKVDALRGNIEKYNKEFSGVTAQLVEGTGDYEVQFSSSQRGEFTAEEEQALTSRLQEGIAPTPAPRKPSPEAQKRAAPVPKPRPKSPPANTEGDDHYADLDLVTKQDGAAAAAAGSTEDPIVYAQIKPPVVSGYGNQKLARYNEAGVLDVDRADGSIRARMGDINSGDLECKDQTQQQELVKQLNAVMAEFFEENRLSENDYYMEVVPSSERYMTSLRVYRSQEARSLFDDGKVTEFGKQIRDSFCKTVEKVAPSCGILPPVPPSPKLTSPKLTALTAAALAPVAEPAKGWGNEGLANGKKRADVNNMVRDGKDEAGKDNWLVIEDHDTQQRLIDELNGSIAQELRSLLKDPKHESVPFNENNLYIKVEPSSKPGHTAIRIYCEPGMAQYLKFVDTQGKTQLTDFADDLVVRLHEKAKEILPTVGKYAVAQQEREQQGGLQGGPGLPGF